MPGRPALAALSIVALLLAGCSSGDPPAASDDAPGATDLGLEATETTGLIRGIVVDEAIRPLANATVTLVGDVPVRQTTGSDGAFGFDGLAPGTYFLKVAKLGYFDIQQSADVVAGLANPDAVKVQLVRDVSFQAFSEAFVYEGFIECTTSALVLCGAPNAIEPLMCAGADPLPPLCYGQLTNDRFTFTQFFSPNATMVQTELVWQTNQAASPALYLEVEALTPDCPQTDLSTTLNGTSGASPIFVRVFSETLEEYEIGPDCGIYYSVFSGDATGDPTGEGVPVGVTVEQRFTAYTHAFYGYLPPVDWRFSVDSTVPPPPV